LAPGTIPSDVGLASTACGVFAISPRILSAVQRPVPFLILIAHFATIVL